MRSKISNEGQIVISWLREHGYYNLISARQGHVIVADGQSRKMVVTVEPFVDKQVDMKEVQKFALDRGREIWTAIVSVSHRKESQINWQKVRLPIADQENDSTSIVH